MNTSRSLLSFAVTTTLAALAADAGAQQILRSTIGDQPGSGFGRTLQPVADIDGDGTTDLVIGEPQRDFGSFTNGGAAVLWRTGAWVMRTRTFGTTFGGGLGNSVAGLGDVDGDSVPDWACGAPGQIPNGLVRVLSGATGLQLYELTGESLSQFGSAICSIGDRDGNGRADLAVGAPQNSPSTPNGVVRLQEGTAGALLATLNGTSNTGFGRTLATVGDLTGDGQPEIAIGEPLADTNGTDSGRVMIKNPRDGAPNSYLWQTTTAFPAGSNGGTALAGVGDVNADGKPDLAVACSNNTVKVLDGFTGAVLFTIANSEFGGTPSLAGIGDWNGDGVRDLAVGAPVAGAGSGRVFVHSLAGGSLLSTIQGGPLSQFGAAVAGVGDLDGDGRAELAIGAPGHLVGGIVYGRVSVHSFDIPAQTSLFGSGCAGSTGTPSLFFNGSPRLGSSFDIQCSNLLTNSIGLWLLSLSNTSVNGIPLPVSLAPAGFPGCTLLVSGEVPEPFATTGSTLATRTFQLPTTPSLTTFTFFVQACIFDAAAAGGLAFSNGGRVFVGNL